MGLTNQSHPRVNREKDVEGRNCRKEDKITKREFLILSIFLRSHSFLGICFVVTIIKIHTHPNPFLGI